MPLKLQQDWTDAAVHHANLSGVEPAATCMMSTRHTFQLVNPSMLRFLKSCEVLPFEAFHKHDLLVCSFDIPDCIPSFYQWRQPQKLDEIMFDPASLKHEGDVAFNEFEAPITKCLDSNEADKALKLWATAAERVFDSSCCATEGNGVRLPAKYYFGRCASFKAKKVLAFEPRSKKGRPGDASIPFDTPNIKARSFLKQARRIQNVLWGTRKLDEVFQNELAVQMRNQLQAIVHAGGLGMSFRKWIALQGFPYFPEDLSSFKRPIP